MAHTESGKGKKRLPGRRNAKKSFIDFFLAFLVAVLLLGIVIMVIFAILPPQGAGPQDLVASANPEIQSPRPSSASVLVPLPSESTESAQPSQSPLPSAISIDIPAQENPTPSPHQHLAPSASPHSTRAPSATRRPGSTKAPLPPVPSPLATIPAKGKPVLYLVLDDAGYAPAKTIRFLKIPIPLTVAVLPGLPDSAKVAELVRNSGDEVLLHQPMESVGEVITAPGLIRSDDEAARAKKQLEANIRSLGTIVGVNNHQGSRGTQDIALMRSVMSVLKRNGLFFLDSRTTALTVAEQASREAGVGFMKRDIFLDNIADENEIRKALEKGMETARKQGYAVMIGHVWSDELYDVLLQDHLDLQSRGFSFEMLSSFLMFRNPARPEPASEAKHP